MKLMIEVNIDQDALGQSQSEKVKLVADLLVDWLDSTPIANGNSLCLLDSSGCLAGTVRVCPGSAVLTGK